MDMTIQTTIPGVEEPGDDLRTLMTWARKLAELDQKTGELLEEAEKVKGEANEYRYTHIPRIMQNIGIDTITFDSGKKIALKEDVFASISADRMQAAVQFLRNKNMAGIVKTNYLIQSDQVTQAREHGVIVQETSTINANTLRAFVKERIAVDENFPKDIFGVSVRPVAKIGKA